jgi:hypothetical protein
VPVPPANRWLHQPSSSVIGTTTFSWKSVVGPQRGTAPCSVRHCSAAAADCSSTGSAVDRQPCRADTPDSVVCHGFKPVMFSASQTMSCCQQEAVLMVACASSLCVLCAVCCVLCAGARVASLEESLAVAQQTLAAKQQQAAAAEATSRQQVGPPQASSPSSHLLRCEWR